MDATCGTSAQRAPTGGVPTVNSRQPVLRLGRLRCWYVRTSVLTELPGGEVWEGIKVRA